MFFSLKAFPPNPEVKDECGLPWGCTIQPLCRIPKSKDTKQKAARKPFAHEIARCGSCFGYMNPYCEIRKNRWVCSICQESNSFPSKDENPRYLDPTAVLDLPEKTEHLIEYDVDQGNEIVQPVFLAVIDTSGDANYIELIKKSLLACLESLPKNCMFGMITYSDCLGVFDLSAGPLPHVQFIRFNETEELNPALTTVFPSPSFLIELGENEPKILAAIDSLSVSNAFVGQTKRGFGVAMSSLLEYFESLKLEQTRWLCFVRNEPNFGIGKLNDPAQQASNKQKQQQNAQTQQPQPGSGQTKSNTESADLSPETNFYRELAQRATLAGVCIDLFLAPEPNVSVGLASIKFLSTLTGGNVFHYSDVENATLPQDIFHVYSGNLGFRGLLRIRTSTGFKISHSFGHLSLDQNIENLFHIAGVDRFRSFAFDFEFTDGTGFYGATNKPIVQLAFSYAKLVNKIGKGENHTSRRVLQQKLRVHTVQLIQGQDLSDIFAGCDVNVVLSLLTQKIIRSVLDESIEEARLVLQDWLTILISKYNHRFPSAGSIDVTFSKYSSLKNLPRFVFALLKNPLLSAQANADSDYWNYLQCLYSSLDCRSLQKAIYPQLNAYSSVSNLHSQNLNLSRNYVVNAQAPIFVLDAFFLIVVLYLDSNDDQLQFPPPQTSQLRHTLNFMKGEKVIAPKILITKTSDPKEQTFWNLLFEEDATMSNQTGQTYSQFLQLIQMDVQKIFGKEKT